MVIPTPLALTRRLGTWMAFTLILGLPLGPAFGQTVDSLVLVDSVTNQDLLVLTDGATIDVSTLGSGVYNVRAAADASQVGSIRFGFDGDPEHRIENSAPFALFGDAGGDFNDWVPDLGTISISATPFDGPDASGSAGTVVEVTVSFEDLGTPGSGNQRPVVHAGPAAFALSPINSATLSGSATDPDGSIVSVAWTQLYGPAVTILGADTWTPTIEGIATGTVAVLRLSVEDDQGGVGTDDVIVAGIEDGVAPGTVWGETRVWHRVTVDFLGPAASESGTPNPFLDHRLDVVFSKGDRSFVVPGHFAADGDSADSGATSGNVWRAHFVPDEEGLWEYTALFRNGADVAIAEDPGLGVPERTVNGARGQFSVLSSDKTGRDHRAHGFLEYVGGHYLRFAGSGRYFIKGGADSPENFLGYADFDGTYDIDGTFIHEYAPHVADWNPGDPEWSGNRGHGMIGALNYLSGKGMNSVYFLTNNVTGDGQDVWPWTSPMGFDRYDCSKLDQWEIVFSHMDQVGIQLHVVLQEIENDDLLDGGDLGPMRRLYHRELVSRFSHHLALIWNLGEETSVTHAQRLDWCDHFQAIDPYDHPVKVHTRTVEHTLIFQPLLGYENFEGPSLQGALSSVHPETLYWREASAQAGRPWVVCNDENGPPGTGVVPDSEDFSHFYIRYEALWGHLMAGGAGNEWYFGFNYPNGDRDCEDWRSRDNMWNLTRYALEFFEQHLPFWEMEPDDSLVSNSAAFCLADPGNVYAVYQPYGGITSIDVEAGEYEVLWFDPRNGGALQFGSVTSVTGPGFVGTGSPPQETSMDWVVLFRTAAQEFSRGDCNGDGSVDLSDVVRQLEVIIQGGAAPLCHDACDVNDDGNLQISDPIFLLSVLFEGATLPAPAGVCDSDPTADALGCMSSGGCP